MCKNWRTGLTKRDAWNWYHCYYARDFKLRSTSHRCGTSCNITKDCTEAIRILICRYFPFYTCVCSHQGPSFRSIILIFLQWTMLNAEQKLRILLLFCFAILPSFPFCFCFCFFSIEFFSLFGYHFINAMLCTSCL